MQHFHRGERRFQKRRLFEKRLMQNLNYRILVDHHDAWRYSHRESVSKGDWAFRNAQRRTTTGVPCSCWMCANPRKWKGNSLTGLSKGEYRAIKAERADNRFRESE